MRVLLVPFHPTNLLMVGIFCVLLTICLSVGCYGLFAALFLQIWVFKYCYVLIEHLADGATEPPVMDTDMLSPFESAPVDPGSAAVRRRHGSAAGSAAPRASTLGIVLLALFPATVAILGFRRSGPGRRSIP